MAGQKSAQTRVVGTITDEMHPYTFFIETLLLENKMWGCTLSVILLFLFVYFLSSHPYSLQFI